MAEAPRVTGLSPNQGPPGTRVTIRGQNLGHNASDVVDLTICGYNCVSWAEWKSPMKILCRTGPGVGKGEIIVTTRSGGEGTCTVTFRGYMEKIGPTEVSAVWIDEPDLEGKDKLHMLKPRDPLGYDHVLEIPSTEDELEELYPDGTGELTSENFIAAWYLLEYHRNTSFSELQEGLKHLRHEVAQRKRGPIAFVKRNINTFIDCHDTLTAVHQMLLESESKSEGGSITYKLETIVEEAGDSADKLFATVLRRKDRADATRNALSVLQRFRYFFSLPRTIERNIEQEEYEVVINGYENAKSLIQDKEVQAFKRVLEEVESLVGKCRDKLRMKLEENPSTLGERKRLIRYMVELGCEGNPAWDCLLSQHRWITKLIEKCKTDYQPQKDERAATDDGETGTHGRAHAMSFNSTGSKGSGSGSLSPQRMLSFSRGSSLGRTGSAIWCKVESSMPIRIQFIEELCDLMSAPQSIPDLWQLAQAYFSENLVENLIVTADTLQEQEEKCNSMLQSLLNYFADLLRLTFFPTYWDEMSEDQHAQLGSWTPFKETKQEAAGAWLPFCVRHVRSCFSSLSRLQLPREVLNSFRQFVVDLRLHCTKRLFEQSIKDINGLKAREDWHTEIDECGCITSLPVLFENICMEVLLGVKEVVIDSKPGENSRSYHVQALQREAAEQLTECFHVFVDVLDALAFYQESGGPTHSTVE
ncbi:exocyst complex component 2-like [Corticium candelabrum]|uniref:exocyst complex component 2-like n=1 Tax=Corticium candelabrum TaxID=121492 RepID=UPI002E252519|nr:exocyst complex component 2-like [Corticium candelabrum]